MSDDVASKPETGDDARSRQCGTGSQNAGKLPEIAGSRRIGSCGDRPGIVLRFPRRLDRVIRQPPGRLALRTLFHLASLPATTPGRATD
jgi:hypothetical protein